jgi:hypothetical protein
MPGIFGDNCWCLAAGTDVVGLRRASICVVKQWVCEVLDVYSLTTGESRGVVLL